MIIGSRYQVQLVDPRNGHAVTRRQRPGRLHSQVVRYAERGRIAVMLKGPLDLPDRLNLRVYVDNGSEADYDVPLDVYADRTEAYRAVGGTNTPLIWMSDLMIGHKQIIPEEERCPA